MFGDAKRRLARIERTLDHIINIIPHEEFTAADILTEMAKALNGGEIPEHEELTVTEEIGRQLYGRTYYTAAGIGKALADGLTKHADVDIEIEDETDLISETAYEPMTLPEDVRAMLTAQLRRLDKLAETADSAGLCTGTDALYSISQSMCAIAKELRE